MGESVDSGWVEQQIGYLLRRAAAAMAADWAGHAEPGELRPVQISLLSVVAANPGIGQSELGQTLGIQRTNTAPLVGRLVEDGLIDRRPSPTDGRRVELHLTEAGRAAFDEGQRRIAIHERRALAGLTGGEVATLRRLLPLIG